MPELVEYQRQFAAALLGLPGVDHELGAHPAIAVHRRTVLSGLSSALALSFPTVIKLTGPDYFARLVSEFASQRPPQSAVLHDYGAELPAFLAAFAGAESYPYFCDVARFDWAVDQTAHRVRDRFASARAIPGYGRLRLSASLTCARFEYAVDLIRDAVESDWDGELPRVDVRPTPRWLALWRSSRGTSVKALSTIAWHILKDLATGSDGESALQRATERCSSAQVWTALCDEILPSSFARLN